MNNQKINIINNSCQLALMLIPEEKLKEIFSKYGYFNDEPITIDSVFECYNIFGDEFFNDLFNTAKKYSEDVNRINELKTNYEFNKLIFNFSKANPISYGNGKTAATAANTPQTEQAAITTTTTATTTSSSGTDWKSAGTYYEMGDKVIGWATSLWGTATKNKNQDANDERAYQLAMMQSQTAAQVESEKTKTLYIVGGCILAVIIIIVLVFAFKK